MDGQCGPKLTLTGGVAAAVKGSTLLSIGSGVAETELGDVVSLHRNVDFALCSGTVAVTWHRCCL